MFKKKKILNKSKNKIIINLIWLIIILLIFMWGVFAISYTQKIDFFYNKKNLDKNQILNLEKKQELIKKEKKQVDINENKINILILWRWWDLNDAPNLTDSIILASINKDLKTISMFSIPRDLYVKYKSWYYWKINTVYALVKAKTWSESDWIDAIKYNVELLTWEKIDYYINIDFKGFIKFIDAIWWIEITVPKTLVDNKFPDNNWGYRTFIIKKWTWLFTWETALNYARSRHSTSDFDRSIRQQQIIKALRDKLTKWWFFEKLSNANKLYQVFEKYVLTDIWLTDAIKIFNEFKNSYYTIISSNLNDSCFEWGTFCTKWWFLYSPKKAFYGGSSVLLVKGSKLWKINNYQYIKNYTNLVFNNPKIFKENIEISILNSTQIPLLAWNLALDLRKYWFNIPRDNKSVSNLRKKNYIKSVIQYTSKIKNSKTIKHFKNIFKDIEFKEVNDLEYSLNINSQIEIIIWEDYKNILKSFYNNL